MNLKAIHYVSSEDACMHSVIVHGVWDFLYDCIGVYIKLEINHARQLS